VSTDASVDKGSPLTVLTNWTSVSGSGTDTGCRTTVLNTEKMAVLAPMPNARVITAVAAKLGSCEELGRLA